MEVRIIDEKSGNPFRYYRNEEVDENYPRSYSQYRNIHSVIKRLINQIGIPYNIDCLEIGAGSNPNPSRALTQLGAKAATLDADWHEKHDKIPNTHVLNVMRKKLGKKILVPRLAGHDGDVGCYLGDMAFLSDPASHLRDIKFDLLYFWGSIDYTGVCSSVMNSAQAKNMDVDIEHAERMIKALPHVRGGGTVLSVAQYFSGHRNEFFSAYNYGSCEKPRYRHDDIDYSNMCMAEMALLWANAKSAGTLGIFIQSPKAVRERHSKELKTLSKEQRASTDQMLHETPLTRITKTRLHGCIFGEENDFEKLRQAQEVLGPEVNKLKNLGIIDAVYLTL